MSIKDSSFVKEFSKMADNMWLKGWDERNGGNISYRILKDELSEYKDELVGTREIALPFSAKELAGEYFLVTGSGKYFKNVLENPEANAGVIKISQDGSYYTILWGLLNNAVPTSELAAHLMSHIERMKVTSGKNRVIMHTHATNIIALSYVLDLDAETFTKNLWQMSTECLVVFPEGIGVIPWMVPGKDEIGRATAEQMKDHRMVLWPFHGIFGAGNDLDEAFGLIDTAEKAAEILVKVIAMGGKKQTLTDQQMKDLAEGFKVHPIYK